jgi:predicted small lipoprotein YifL
MALLPFQNEFSRGSDMVRAIREPALTAALLSRLAVIGALATAFALAGCGRKGPLDPPPGYAERVAQEQTELQRQAMLEREQQPQRPGGLFGFDQPDPQDEAPPPPRAPSKRFFLDWLLN